MNAPYVVIVSKYNNGCAYENIFRGNFSSPEVAVSVAKDHVGEGKSVLIRPTFNEVKDGVLFFRDWRSFDGKAFEECIFTPPGMIPLEHENHNSAGAIASLL